MKATIELDDLLYRRLKAAAALQGRNVKDLVAEGVRRVLEEPLADGSPDKGVHESRDVPAWVGSLRSYAANAGGQHKLEAMRRSVAAGRARATE